MGRWQQLARSLSPRLAGTERFRATASVPLQFREYRQCTVMPYRPGEVRGALEMGVFDANGACIESTLIRRVYANGREGEIGLPIRVESAATVHEGPVIYLGPILEQFGHFLLESLARVWLAKRHPELPVVWSCPAGADAEGKPPLRRWQSDILDMLGLADRSLFATTPMGFGTLLVPEAGYRIQHYFHPEQAEALACRPHRPEPGRKLWLSRTRLRQLQNLSMPALEHRLTELGWTVVYPETLTIAEQLDQFAAAERIAGELGSALHTLVFLKDPGDLRVDVFLRDPRRSPDHHNKNYDTIASAKGLDQRLHRMTSETVLRERGVQVEKRSSDPGEYLRALDEADPAAATTHVPAEGARWTNTEEEQPMSTDLAPPADPAPPAAVVGGERGDRPGLDALARQFNTDKASLYRTRDGKEIAGHDYAGFYDRFFRDFRDEPITVMELGCGQVWNIGASLRMLKAYFPKAEIVGVDNKPAARKLAAEGFRIEVGDLSRIEFLRRLRRHRPTVLIDDASHLWSHQILAMAELYDTMPSGGIYVMEDINTSFGHMRETYSEGATFSGHDFVSAVCTTIHAFDASHLASVPYPEYVAYVARQTALVAQFRHTALFVRR